MWVVAKFNNGQENLFKQELSKKIKNTIMYSPKIKISFFKNNKILYKEKSLMCGYLFCFSKEFSNSNLDFLLADEEILKDTKDKYSDDPSFKLLADWTNEMASRLKKY